MTLPNPRFLIILTEFLLLGIQFAQGLKYVSKMLLFLHRLLGMSWVGGIFTLFFTVLELNKPFTILLFLLFLPLLGGYKLGFEGWVVPT